MIKENGATAAPSQGVTSDSDNSQKSVARCRPHRKEYTSYEDITRTSGSLIDREPKMTPV